MTERYRLGSLGNRELLAALSGLVRRGNELTSDMLAHLAEVYERRLHLELGYPSLFAYCTRALGLSESSAGRRIAAARVCRRFPEAFEHIACGALHLSALCSLSPHLNPDNAAELFMACGRKRARQVEELLAARFPKPDLRDAIRRLPSGVDTRPAGAARLREAGLAANEADPPADVPENRRPRLTPSALETGPATNGRTETGTGTGTEKGSGPRTEQAPAPGLGPSAGLRPQAAPRQRELEPLSGDRFGVRFTADREFLELLELVRALASHRCPDGDLLSLMKHGLKAYLRELEKSRFALGRRPRVTTSAAANSPRSSPTRISATTKTPSGRATKTRELGQSPEDQLEDEVSAVGEPKPGAADRLSGSPHVVASCPTNGALPTVGCASVTPGHAADPSKHRRHVPAAVAREVYLRDQKRCTFLSKDGRRCAARHFLELDHVVPWALGGETSVENLRLRCRAHNQQHAADYFGQAHVEAARAARERRRRLSAIRGEASAPAIAPRGR